MVAVVQGLPCAPATLTIMHKIQNKKNVSV
jgi:hypothetical protein